MKTQMKSWGIVRSATALFGIEGFQENVSMYGWCVGGEGEATDTVWPPCKYAVLALATGLDLTGPDILLVLQVRCSFAHV